MILGKIEPIDIQIGKKIKMLRNLKCMNQEKLGEILGVSFQQIQKYESGVNRISAGNLYTISEKLKVEMIYFFKDNEKYEMSLCEVNSFSNNNEAYNALHEDSNDFIHDEGENIIENLNKIDENIKSHIVSLIQCLSEK